MHTFFSKYTETKASKKNSLIFYFIFNSLIFCLPEYTALHPSCLGDFVIFQGIDFFLISKIRLLEDICLCLTYVVHTTYIVFL
jgi:hypothetical protein